MIAVNDNLLAVEEAIEARLRAGLDARIHLLTAPDLAGVAEERQIVPAVHLLYGGMQPVTSQARALTGQFEQRWWTVVAVRNVSDPKRGKGARSEAGPILADVVRLLAGWRPDEDEELLRPIAPPGPAYHNGYAYFPLAWAWRHYLYGDGSAR